MITTLCLKKPHHFYVCDYWMKCRPILIKLGNVEAEKICKQMTFLSYNIQFVYEYYTVEKQEGFCMLSMLPLRLAVVLVSCSIFKRLFSPQLLFRNSFIRFFLLHNLYSLKFSINIWSSSLKPMFTSNHRHQIVVYYKATRVQYPNK